MCMSVCSVAAHVCDPISQGHRAVWKGDKEQSGERGRNSNWPFQTPGCIEGESYTQNIMHTGYSCRMHKAKSTGFAPLDKRSCCKEGPRLGRQFMCYMMFGQKEQGK